MKFGELVCFFLNNIFPKRKIAGKESPFSYSEAQYKWAKTSLSFYVPYINLKNKVVLDGGCGLGGKTVFYAEYGCESIFGIDRDEINIKYAKKFAETKGISNIKFLVASLDKLPFESDKFDIIFLNDVVEHIKRPILIKSLEECRRVLKVNGSLCLEFPPWTSYNAAHLYNYIYIPWCQLFFSSETLINVVKKLPQTTRYGRLSFIEHFQELNHITIGEFEDIIRKLDFRVINFKLYMINNIKILRHIPFFKKYLTSRVVAVLSK